MPMHHRLTLEGRDEHPSAVRRTGATRPWVDGSDVLLVISIDTEEDNWIPSRTGVTVENIRELPRMHRFLRGFGVRPTFFTAYSVLDVPWAAEIIRDLDASGDVEIGAHLHPWNTPPLREGLVPRNTMIKNLPEKLQGAKLERLTERLATEVGAPPRSFRSGRFGLSGELLPWLVHLGYRVESSVTPFVDWSGYDGGPDFRGAPFHAYRLGPAADPRIPVPDGPLVELPVLCGFTRTPFSFWSRIHGTPDRPPLRRLRMPGIATRMGIIQKVTLSPETDSVTDMLLLSRSLIEHDVGYLHLFFHSSSLRTGLSPFTPTTASVERFYVALAEYLDRLSKMVRVRFTTVSEAAAELVPVDECLTGDAEASATKARTGASR